MRIGKEADMPGSFRIGRIAGIDIDINVSWLVILVLLTFSLAVSWFPATVPRQSTLIYWVLGFIAALLLFVSVLLHELAHSLVARARGLPVKRITLFIFGGVSDLEQEPQSPGIEFQIAIVGPLTSLAIGAVTLVAGILIGPNAPLVAAVLDYLGVTNLLLGIFNLIPGFPLDGGRVLRAIIWRVTGSLRRATRAAALVGQVIAYLFIVVGIFLFFRGDFINGLWFGFIGWFLLQAAQAANSQVMLESVFKGVTVGQLMSPAALTVPANISLQQLVDDYLLPRGVRAIPVVRSDDQQLLGLVTLADIRHVPSEQWPQTPVGQAMVPLERLHTVRPPQNLNDVLPLMIGRDVNQLLVLDDAGRLVGILSRDAILRYVEVRRGLDLDRPLLSSSVPSEAPPTTLPAAT
jgi:Zn-dependent protease/predicted transcriptional regulator